YWAWIVRYLRFHRDRTGHWKHPRELGATEVGALLNHLANVEHVAAATQNQALNALVFLYGAVLRIELGELGEFMRASRPRRLPVVLSREEVGRLLGALEGTWRLLAQTLYGTGMRLMEMLRLRVKDVREGFGEVCLPEALARKYPNAAKEWGWQWVFPS